MPASVAEEREEEVLLVAATRPALMPFVGLPHGLAIVFVCTAMELVVLTKSFFYDLFLIPVWAAIFLYVRHDYNAVHILSLWLWSKAKSLDVWRWGGASLSSFPIRERTPRGIDQ